MPTHSPTCHETYQDAHNAPLARVSSFTGAPTQSDLPPRPDSLFLIGVLKFLLQHKLPDGKVNETVSRLGEIKQALKSPNKDSVELLERA